MRRRVTRSHREADRSGETPRGVSVERAETARSLGSGMPRLVKSAELFNYILRLKKKKPRFEFTVLNCIAEKEMATHSSVLAWRIPWTGEPAGLLSIGLHRVGHD